MMRHRDRLTALILCVADASVLIDLRNGHVLDTFTALSYHIIVPDAVFAELDPPLRSMIEDLGFEIGGLEATTILEVFGLRSSQPRLSVADLFALFLARDRGAMLLTGDSRLKRLAEAHGLTVHGVLWVLDALLQHQVLDKQGALAALERVLESGGRLPAIECQSRRQSWSE